jgi:excisionase family DNA binding protein
MSKPKRYARIKRHSKVRSVDASSTSKGLYTVQEAAARLNLSPSWLYARTRTNAIPFRRFGKYIRFTDDDLEAIIASGATSKATVIERGA